MCPCGCVGVVLCPCGFRLWQGMLMHSAAALRWQRAGCCLLWGWQRWSRESWGEGDGACGELLALGRDGCPLQSIVPGVAVCSGLRSADLAAAGCIPALHSPLPKPCSCPTLPCRDLSLVPAALPGWVMIIYLLLQAARGMRLPSFVLTELLRFSCPFNLIP